MTGIKLLVGAAIAASILLAPSIATSRHTGFPYEHEPSWRVAIEYKGDGSEKPVQPPPVIPAEAPKTGIKPPVIPTSVPKAGTANGTRRAFVTGYNTLAGQTDSTPCIAAGGNICGRRDVVACPTDLPLHSWVEIDGKAYECMDRTARKHNGRFDISCDKDTKCPFRITGWKTVKVLGG